MRNNEVASKPGFSRPEQQHGVLVLNKPSGLSSAACLNKIKRALGQRKIGHAGTLDPLASGVLLVLLGQATKLSGYLMEGRKIYSGVFRIGQTTDTYDIEGRVTSEADETALAGITPEDLFKELPAWQGLIEQEVPPYSAAKHKGRSLYKLARAGLETPIKKKIVEIFDAQFPKVDLPSVTFRVETSSGAYVRSLVHSLGIRLGVGAVLIELTRQYSHPFALEEAWDLEELLDDPAGFPARVRSLPSALPDWPVIRLASRQADRVRHGQVLSEMEIKMISSSSTGSASDDLTSLACGNTLRAFLADENGQPLALAALKEKNGIRCWVVERGFCS